MKGKDDSPMVRGSDYTAGVELIAIQALLQYGGEFAQTRADGHCLAENKSVLPTAHVHTLLEQHYLQ
jgi:hypothetical protein